MSSLSALDMQIAFVQKVQKFGTEPESHDVFYYLNQAQEEIIRNRYAGRNRAGKAFEQSQELIQDLNKLLSTNETLTPYFVDGFTFGTTRADAAELPKDVFFLISTRVSIFYKRGGIAWDLSQDDLPRRIKQQGDETSVSKDAVLRIAQQDDLFTMLDDPYNKTYARSPLGTQSEDVFTVYTDPTFFVNELHVNYIRQPRMIIRRSDKIQSSELPAYLHREIVQTAVSMYLSNLPKEE